MLTCKQLVEQISDYIDGHLGLVDRMSVRMHLMMCRHCTTYHAQVRQMLDALRTVPPERRPPDFDTLSAAVMAALEAEGGGPTSD